MISSVFDITGSEKDISGYHALCTSYRLPGTQFYLGIRFGRGIHINCCQVVRLFDAGRAVDAGQIDYSLSGTCKKEKTKRKSTWKIQSPSNSYKNETGDWTSQSSE